MLTRHAVSLLDLLERTWAHRLRRVSLAAEADADPIMVRAAAAALGEVHRGLRRGGHLELAERWPACVVVALSAVAAEGYRSGSFWPAWWATTGRRGRAADAQQYGEAFAAALDRLGLPGQDAPNRHLGPILLHAGVPDSCLEGFLRYLLEGRAEELDEPMRRLVEHGDDFAGELAERCLDLLERLRAPDQETDDLGLPRRIVDQTIALVRAGVIDPIPAAERPEITLEPFGGGVRLRPPGSADVLVDGKHAQVDPDGHVPITAPDQSLSVNGHAVRVIDPADPLLIFKEDGHRLPTERALPSDGFWAVFPADRELTGDPPPRVVAESACWPGWRLAQLSPGQATWVGLVGGRRRQVRGKDRPQVLTGPPLPGVTAPSGMPVTASVSVWLPGDGFTWSVEVRQAGRSVLRESRTPSEPVTIPQIWQGVGAVTVVVRGPIGKGARRTVFVASGLSVSHEPELRLLTADGLQRATVRVGADRLPVFTAEETERVFEHRGARLTLSPPHMRVSTDRHAPRARPLRLAVEELGTMDWLRIDGLPPRPLEVRAGGQAVQELPPSARGLFSPRRLLDTIAAHAGADLVYPPDVPVAFVRPAGTASAVEHLGDRLVLRGLVWLDGLVAEVRAGDRREVLPVPEQGVLALPPPLAEADRVLVRLALPDPWTGTRWPDGVLAGERTFR
ncbi:hypothetical protein ACIHFD_04225 [Nonomuraea sp. NPDC051941]|uniref:hypothetical protein n=1 Tax=Nonomuraea sp. NPDC051941 TaxID=3364373 RepID=UPI0037CB05C3